MLFRKISINPKGRDYKGPIWYRILRTYEDVVEYMKIDAELFGNALVNLPTNLKKSHLQGREAHIHTMCQIEAYKDQIEFLSPLEVTNNIVRNKAMRMLEIIQEGKSVLVQKVGSYCDYEGFEKVWAHTGFTVLAEIEKDSTYMPNDSESIETDLVFLENDDRVDVQFFNDVWDQEKLGGLSFGNSNKKQYYKITELKDTDPKWLFEMLQKTKTIAFYTQYANPTQTESMVKMFMKLEPKRFIIRSEYKDEIMNHPMYKEFSLKHNVNWI